MTVSQTSTTILLYTADLKFSCLMEALVQSAGFALVICDSATAVRERLLLPLSLIIIDMKGQESEALLTIAAIRQHARSASVPTIVVVEREDDSLAIACLRAGAQDYVHRDAASAVVLAKMEAHLRYGSLLRRLEQQNQLLEKIAALDELTQLYNRRSLMRALGSELERTDREKSSLGLILIDLDHFKHVNDSYGHEAGDAVLVQFAQLMQASFRICDIVARFGGEEFCAVLPQVTIEQLKRAAERVRETVQHHPFTIHQAQIQCTISVGGAWLPEGKSAGTRRILRCADAALYEAKRLGRNRIGLRNLGDWEASPGCGRIALK
jgi:two-component system cell cycle response regulator